MYGGHSIRDMVHPVPYCVVLFIPCHFVPLYVMAGEIVAVLHRRFFRDEGCRSAFMRVAGLAGLELTPDMLQEVVLEMLALPAVRGETEGVFSIHGRGRCGGGRNCGWLLRIVFCFLGLLSCPVPLSFYVYS